jgi:hypothetical protein
VRFISKLATYCITVNKSKKIRIPMGKNPPGDNPKVTTANKRIEMGSEISKKKISRNRCPSALKNRFMREAWLRTMEKVRVPAGVFEIWSSRPAGYPI